MLLVAGMLAASALMQYLPMRNIQLRKPRNKPTVPVRVP